MTYENPNILDTITEDLLSRFLYPRLFKKHSVLLSLGDEERILEVGCGGGAMTLQLAKAAGSKAALTCVDLLPLWAERARRRMRAYKGVTVVEGDIQHVGLPGGPFTLVFIHYMLHDVPRRNRAAIAGRLAGVLGEGGRIFICEPTKDSHGMPAGEIDELFADAGLEKVGGAADSFPIMGKMYRALYKK